MLNRSLLNPKPVTLTAFFYEVGGVIENSYNVCYNLIERVFNEEEPSVRIFRIIKWEGSREYVAIYEQR